MKFFKENDIAVGEYIRTHKGKFYKVTNVHTCKVSSNHTALPYSTIKSHSNNLHDLVEPGDIVNGHIIHETTNLTEETINTILSHEIYNNNCFSKGE